MCKDSANHEQMFDAWKLKIYFFIRLKLSLGIRKILICGNYFQGVQDNFRNLKM